MLNKIFFISNIKIKGVFTSPFIFIAIFLFQSNISLFGVGIPTGPMTEAEIKVNINIIGGTSLETKPLNFGEVRRGVKNIRGEGTLIIKGDFSENKVVKVEHVTNKIFIFFNGIENIDNTTEKIEVELFDVENKDIAIGNDQEIEIKIIGQINNVSETQKIGLYKRTTQLKVTIL